MQKGFQRREFPNQYPAGSPKKGISGNKKSPGGARGGEEQTISFPRGLCAKIPFRRVLGSHTRKLLSKMLVPAGAAGKLSPYGRRKQCGLPFRGTVPGKSTKMAAFRRLIFKRHTLLPVIAEVSAPGGKICREGDNAAASGIEWEGMKESEEKMKNSEREESLRYRVSNCPDCWHLRGKTREERKEERRREQPAGLPRSMDVFLCALFCLLATTLALLCAAPFSGLSEREGIGAAGNALRQMISENPAAAVFFGIDEALSVSADPAEETPAVSRENPFSYLTCSAEEYLANPPVREAEKLTGCMPCEGRIISGFSYRDNPLYGIAGTERYVFHSGIDIPAVVGSPALAFSDGTVLKIGNSAELGLYLELDHGGGWTSVYAHLSEVEVSAGQAVREGERIARTGASGMVTGAHLHFELREKGIPVNPEHYIQ